MRRCTRYEGNERVSKRYDNVCQKVSDKVTGGVSEVIVHGPLPVPHCPRYL